MRTIRSLVLGFTALTMLVAASGCSSKRDWKFADMFDLNKGMPWHDDDEDPEAGMPTRVVGTWTDTVLTQAGKTPQRGFGGRLLFYDNESKEPIYVEGQLVIYAFDETNREVTDNRPTRRYVFPAEQVPLHMSKTELGPSYSFWLPWDEAGGPQTEVSLICRFEPTDGPLVLGEQTKHMLPGAMIAASGPPKLPEGVPFKPVNHQALYDAGTQSAGEAAQPTSYESQAAAGTLQPTERRMETTSISLPQSFRVQGAPQTASPRAASSANGLGAIPSSHNSAGTIPSAPTPPGAPSTRQQQVIPNYGYPGASNAPFGPPQFQTIAPAGSSANPSGYGQLQQMPEPIEQIPQGQPQQQVIPGGLSTTVTVLTPGESARRRWGQQSLGSTPVAPPAPGMPTSR